MTGAKPVVWARCGLLLLGRVESAAARLGAEVVRFTPLDRFERQPDVVVVELEPSGGVFSWMAEVSSRLPGSVRLAVAPHKDRDALAKAEELGWKAVPRSAFDLFLEAGLSGSARKKEEMC